MITGFVNQTGIPFIPVRFADRDLLAVVDSGFNGDLELPETLFGIGPQDYLGSAESFLAGGQQVEEDVYQVPLEFDGRSLHVETTFADTQTALVGTRLLREHHLEIDFPAKTVRLKRVLESRGAS